MYRYHIFLKLEPAGKHFLGTLPQCCSECGGACLFEEWFSQAIGPGVGMLVPGLALLKGSFSSGMGEAVFSRGCWQCPFPPTLYWESVSSWPSPTFAVCRLWWMSILTGGIWFHVIVLIVFPSVIIRDAEHLLQYHFFSQRI